MTCICKFHLDANCPRHGLKKPKEERKRPWWSSLPYKSESREEEQGDWNFIRRCAIAFGLGCAHKGRGKCEGRLDGDHIVPSGKGGPWTPENFQLLCRRHHDIKHGNQPKWTTNDDSRR